MIDWLLLRFARLADAVRGRVGHYLMAARLRRLQRSGSAERWGWFYHIPAWGEEKRATFADVWLLPDVPEYPVDPLWITIDAVLSPDFVRYASLHVGLHEMGDAPFHMDLGKMHLAVRAQDFDEKECIDWIGRWLESTGMGLREIRPGPLEWFATREEDPREHAPLPPIPIPFPLRLGVHISEIDDEITREHGGRPGEALSLELAPGRRDQRRFYTRGELERGVVQVMYTFNEDGVVWSIGVDRAAPSYSGMLGRVPLTADIEGVIAALGPPDAEAEKTIVLRSYLWRFPTEGYRVEAFYEVYDDITGYYPVDQVFNVEWWDPRLAPPGYPERRRGADAGDAEAS